MDSFLSDLYKENMEKMAGVELKEFYDSLSVEQLEQVLGLTKVAVEGDATPEIPDGSPVKKYLDAAEKAVAKKTTPPELPTASSTVAGTSTMESGKQLLQSSTGKPEPTTPFVPREIKTTDDPGLGSRDAESKTAGIKNFVKRVGQLVGGGDVNALKRAKGARLDRYAQEGPAGKKLQELREAWKASDNRAISSERHKVLGARAGLGLAAAGGTAAALHKGKNKNSTVFDQLEGKTAEKRAELVITALRAIKDAPEHVKHAAAKYVGERL